MFKCETWRGSREDNLEDDFKEDVELDDDPIPGGEGFTDNGSHFANSVGSYFRQMARGGVLTREEETDLARRIVQLKQRVATWIRRYPALLPATLPEMEDDSDRPTEEPPSMESEEITEGLIRAMERNFSDFIGRLDRAEAALRECEARSGFPHQEILRLASKVAEESGAIFDVPIPQDDLLSLQAGILCALYEMRAVEMATGASKDLLKKDYEEFLDVLERLRGLKSRFVEANLRLVISVARKFRGRGIPFLDLIQEGNLGLMRAVDKFDYRLGFKFSTYASWWIRQAMFRVIQNHAQTIRTPVHVIELRNKVMRTIGALSRETGSRPSLQDIAKATGLSEEKVAYAIQDGEGAGTRTISLDTPIGGGESQLLDFLMDEESTSPEEACMERNVARGIEMILSTLTSREEMILRKRFGIGDGRTHTLEELGQEFGVTRERIRQIETKALLKLRHPCRRKEMEALADL
jgi:RNA polymerase primary sigma factor